MTKTGLKKIPWYTGMVCAFFWTCSLSWLWAGLSEIDPLVGDHDAVLVMSDNDQCLYQKNADNPLVPASTLKVLTSLAAFQFLGEDFTFKTEFYLDEKNNLTIKGYGDPLLVSENISQCCEFLSREIRSKTTILGDILIDDSYFGLVSVPGAVDDSIEPYDSVNGALCANFNTVFFKRDASGRLVSAEPQTPLLPFVEKRILSSGLKQGRILLTKDESQQYAGYLFKHFLEQQGLTVSGKVAAAPSPPSTKTLIYTYISLFSLRDTVSQLLEYSNNFIANQLCLITGASQYGPPASFEKGVTALKAYLESPCHLTQVTLVEGSGLSRQNRISARNMDHLLKRFEPYRTLMRENDRTFYKTGTLNGISTRVGYIKGKEEHIYRFVVFCNSPGKSSENITQKLLNLLKRQGTID